MAGAAGGVLLVTVLKFPGHKAYTFGFMTRDYFFNFVMFFNYLFFVRVVFNWNKDDLIFPLSIVTDPAFPNFSMLNKNSPRTLLKGLQTTLSYLSR